MLLFNTITIIGAGLIGSSLARAAKQLGLARRVIIADNYQPHLDATLRIGFADDATDNLAEAVADADVVVLATPVSTFEPIMQAIAPHLPQGCIVTDVGSVKQAVIAAVEPYIPAGCHFVPGHPIAGTEHSGPDAGFAELFQGRWCILTPTSNTSLTAIDPIQKLWEAVGANISIMDPQHHDSVLAMTSHVPHLIAFATVNAAADMGAHIDQEVLQISATTFSGFTRVAASDPIMWRDIFLANREPLLAQLNILQEEIATLTRAIRWGDSALVEERLTKARALRRQLKG